VAWRSVSADSHPIQGAFTFSVGDAAPADLSQLEQTADDPRAGGSAAAWLGVGRALSYAGVAIVVGVIAVAGWLAPSVLTSRRSGLLLGLALDAALIGTVMMIAAQASIVADGGFDPEGWRTVIETQSGRWWLVRLLLLFVTVAVVLGRGFIVRRRLTAGVAAVAATALLGVVAGGGHATTGRLAGLGFVATVVHLAAMAVWAGGLAALVMMVPAGDRWRFATRFSPIALGAVAVLAVTGTLNALRQNAFGGLTDTSYGRWLLIKLALVVVVVAVAVISRRLIHGSAVSVESAELAAAGSVGAARNPAQPLEQRLRRTVAFELAGMAVIVAATAGLVNSPPPIAAAASTWDSATAVVEEDGLSVQITVDPAVTGGTLMHVTLTEADPTAAEPDEMTVQASLAAQGLGPLDLEVVPAGPGHVVANNVDFPVPGTWTITVTARYGDFDQHVFNADVTIR
ncbi:MAG: CopD family protein, partial [Ilumatobacteraceae bacterium]